MATRRAAVVIVLALLGVAREAQLARAPDIRKVSFEWRGAPARTFAALLQLPADRAQAATFELSQSDEHRALPERDAALREPDGALSSELAWRVSTVIRMTATWDPSSPSLRLEGWAADLATALPDSAARGTFAFTSPGFAEQEIDRLPGWRPLLVPALAAPARPLPAGVGGGETHTTDTGGASLILTRVHTWNAKNQPVERSYLSVRFTAPAR